MRSLHEGAKHVWNYNIPRFGRSRFPFSKPGGFNVAWFEISEKRSSNGVEQLQQCAMINKVLIYIRQHPQLKKKQASPLPSTSHTIPMLFGKCKCQVKLWWATCSDAPPCFHPTPPFFRCQHFGSTRPVGKKDAGLLSSSPGQCASSAFGELEGNLPGADWWPAIRQLSRLAILWHSTFYILLHIL